jgi:lysophospholipase L1-like esterase
LEILKLEIILKPVFRCFLLLNILFFSVATHSQPFSKRVQRILFLGNSITYEGTYIMDLEAYFIQKYPGRKIEFINAGLPSETVSGLSEPGHADGKFPRPDLHERLARVLALTRPDVVFACYGMNDGIYMPFDEGRFGKFKEGINWLHEEVVKTGARIIHLTPPVYDETRGSSVGYAAVLDRYAEWLINQRVAAKWEVGDIHFPMKEALEKRRAADVSFTFAQDGIHPGAEGHWVMARAVLSFLGEVQEAAADSPQAGWESANGKAIYKLVAERQKLMKDAWLTAAGHKRPGMDKGVPMDEARKKYAVLEEQIRALLKNPGAGK